MGLPVKRVTAPRKASFYLGKKARQPFKVETMSVDECLPPPHTFVITKPTTLSMYSVERDEPGSFKVDNSPEVVKHLVQTLGLIGVSNNSLDKIFSF